LGGDALFIGGMMLVFSVLCRGFGLIGLILGPLLIIAGGCLLLLARHDAPVAASVPAHSDAHD
jgi:hypothetical protein